MKVGDYIRTDIGEIRKVVRVTDDLYILDKDIVFAHKDKIKKSSPNIIDICEVGDYVNGEKVIRLFNPTFLSMGELPYVITDKSKYEPQEIQNVVTKECFESMEYKVKE